MLVSDIMLWSDALNAVNEKTRQSIIRVASQLKLVKPILVVKPQKARVVLATHHPCEMECAVRGVGVIEVNPSVSLRSHRRVARIGANEKARLPLTAAETRQIEPPSVPRLGLPCRIVLPNHRCWR
jgi:hypothetical protein